MKEKEAALRPTSGLFMNTEETKSWGCLGLRCLVGCFVGEATRNGGDDNDGDIHPCRGC
ncbi:hypothetical protein X777_15469 [Ooceraea biroi]|uniref:Uncharacterized protein n=1 Tax=Ooceraea biroi TaxID=2015173 RepID=A0A026VW43_OOCBI|nr:hypothetical protein X777_15469 [Ooceraea biroi]